MIVLDLGIPPSVNHCYLKTPGKVVLSPAAKRYKEEVAWIANGRTVPAEVPLSLYVTYRYPDGRHELDCDNLGKVLVDSVAKALKFNDKRVTKLYIEKVKDRHNPGVRVTVEW